MTDEFVVVVEPQPQEFDIEIVHGGFLGPPGQPRQIQNEGTNLPVRDVINVVGKLNAEDVGGQTILSVETEGLVTSESIVEIVSLTQVAYDALDLPDLNTLYVIVE